MASVSNGPVRPRPAIRNLWRPLLAIGLSLFAAASCRWDDSPESPYLPGSKDYAGDDWTHDSDGDGVADSVEKYAPGCALPPGLCLRNALTLKEIPPGRLKLRAENLIFRRGDPPREPELAWTPPEAALRGYSLSSSDTDVISIRAGRLFPKGAGKARIAVASPGFPELAAGFLARVVEEGTRLDSLHAVDLVLAQGEAALPSLTWYPADAAFREYALSVEPDSIAVAAGDSIRAVKPGQAKALVVAADGLRRAEFAIRVVPAIPGPALEAKPLFLVAGDAPAAPQLAWDPPEAALSGYRLSLPETASAIAVTPDSAKVAPRQPGKARVRVVSGDGKAQAEFEVVVSARRIAVAGLKADAMSLVLQDGPQAPALHWQPEDADDRGYTLASWDSSVAIPWEGKVKPLKPGRTVFIAAADEGGFSAEFWVTVRAGSDSQPGPDPKPDPDPDPGPKPDPDSLTALSVAPLSLQVGETRAPVLAWMPAGAAAPAYTLVPEDTAVASVDLSGSGPRILGRRAGSTQAVLRAGGLSAAFRITVTETVVAVVSVQAADFSLDLRDPPYVPAIAFTPSDATDRSYTLIAPDAEGAIRIEANKVVPVRVGKSPLRIVPNGNPAAAAVCSATVTARVRSVSAPNDTLLPGSEAKPAAGRLTWDPPEAPDKSFRLVTKDTGVVRISAGGTSYQGLSAGTAKVIVQALDGSGAADTFTVLVRIPLTRLIAKDLTLPLSDSIVNPWFLFTFVPSNASNQGWSFLYPDANEVPPSSVVAIVDHWMLRAVGLGKANLIAYSLGDKAIRDTFTVTVVLPVQSLSFAPPLPITLRAGDPDFQPVINVMPANASIRTWRLSSANPAIATVIGGTSVRALKAGATTLTAVSDDNPQAKATVELRVLAWP